MATKKRNLYGGRLTRAAKAIGKARPAKIYGELFEAFVIVAAAGDVPRAHRILEWMYGGRVTIPSAVPTALSTATIDGFCLAAGLGDQTGGTPRHEPTVRGGGPLVDRVAEAERTVRDKLTRNAHLGEAPRDDAWRERSSSDPWRRVDRWRRIQALARDGQDEDALVRLAELLDEWAPEDRGAGYGSELVLALDLALRLGRADLASASVVTHGHRFASESFRLQEALCLPAIAKSIAGGALRTTIGLGEADLHAAIEALDAALDIARAAAAAPKATPKTWKRRVTRE